MRAHVYRIRLLLYAAETCDPVEMMVDSTFRGIRKEIRDKIRQVY